MIYATKMRRDYTEFLAWCRASNVGSHSTSPWEVSGLSSVEVSSCDYPCRVIGAAPRDQIGTAVHQKRRYADDEIGRNSRLLGFWKTPRMIGKPGQWYSSQVKGVPYFSQLIIRNQSVLVRPRRVF